jgi:hypothetical protein
MTRDDIEARKARIFSIARERGSRATTIMGALPHVLAAARAWAEARRSAIPKGDRTITRHEWRVLCGERRILARYGQPHLDGLITTYLRWICQERGGLRYDARIVPGDGLSIAGNRRGFRWRGRWKVAPGSYIPSTRHLEVGLRYLAQHCRDLRRREIGGVDTIWEHDSERMLHGYHAYCAAIAGAQVTLITAGDPTARRKPWAYHSREKDV